MRNCFKLGEEFSSFYGLYISGSGTFDSPERDVTIISIPGRNGDLVLDNGRFKNVSLQYPAFVRTGFKEKAAGLRAWLLQSSGYRRLEDTYHPDEFRMARYSGSITFDMRALNTAGECTLTFHCKPQRFLKKGESVREFTAGGNMKNPTRFPAFPQLRIYGNGRLTVGGVRIEVSGNADNYIDIDCEAEDACRGYTNMNSNLTLLDNRFPALPSGETQIEFTGITKVEIKPRWWTV